MRRTALLSAIGIPAFVVGTLSLLGHPGNHQAVMAIVLGGAGAVLMWLAMSGRPVGRAGWLVTGVAGLAGFGLNVLVWDDDRDWLGGVLDGIFWWCAAVLIVVPVGQAVRVVREALRVARDAPTKPPM